MRNAPRKSNLSSALVVLLSDFVQSWILNELAERLSFGVDSVLVSKW